LPSFPVEPAEQAVPLPAVTLLFATLIGGIFKIPIAELLPERAISHHVVDFFGMRYAVPAISHWRGTVVAVNVGGALIPTLMSIYLLIRRELWVKGLVATAIVGLVIHWMADPVPGLGIAVPVFMPVVVTAIVAMILSREDSAPLAYTWVDKKPREHRAAFVIDSLEAAEEATLRTRQGEHA
jgi:uncharacterized membrane protein